MSGIVKGFGRRPIAAVGQAPGPSSESPQGRNPRGVEVGKAPRYGDLTVAWRMAEAVKARGSRNCECWIGRSGLNERC